VEGRGKIRGRGRGTRAHSCTSEKEKSGDKGAGYKDGVKFQHQGIKRAEIDRVRVESGGP